VINKFSHVAVAVNSLEEAMKTYCGVLGLKEPPEGIKEFPELGFRVALLRVGNNFVELVQPTVSNNDVGTFLKDHGEGMFVVCLETDNIDAEIKALKSKGAQLFEMPPSQTIPYKRAFVRRKQAHGVLIELVQSGWHQVLTSAKKK